MSAADIAHALGDAGREGLGCCRCPLHQGRSLTLRDGAGGQLLAWCFGGCDRRDVLIELRRRGLLAGRITGCQRPSPQTSQREDVARTARAPAIWHEARPAGVSNEIVGGSFTAIDIHGVVLGTHSTRCASRRAPFQSGGHTMSKCKRSYRACPVGRTRRTKADISAIRTAIHDVIEDDPPMTVRQVFYQLVARGVIEKTEEQYQGTVIRLMAEMRFDGSLPYSFVVDESRRVRITKTYDSVADAIKQTANFYRRSALAQAPDYIEIWCEKDALAGALWDMTSEYDVPLMVSRGMPSLTFLHASAQAIRNAAERDKKTFIYQFGDHDPSGVLIPKTIERRLDEMCERLDCPPPQVKRIALTEKQIKKHRLPTRPTKRKGNSHAAGFVGRSVELDALPPRVLRDLVRQVIERHISPAQTLALRVAEDSERKLLLAWRPPTPPEAEAAE